MKSNFKVLSISLFCSILTFFIFNNLIKNNEIDYEVSYEIDNVPQYSLNALSNQSNFSSSSSLPDLTFAASKSIDAVVHVKNTSIVEESDRWSLQFFYGDDSKKKVGTGSGVIISPDGYIITNYHVIENSTEVIVTTNDNKEYEAEIIGIDEVYDIAVLKINSDLNLDYVFFGDSDSTLVGEWVLAVGNPYNLNSTVTAGIISSKSRDLNEYDQKNQSFIQTDAAVNFGNSGGALVNTKGELIGINTAIASQTGSYSGYSFAIPINLAKKIVGDLKDFGEVKRAILGVRIQDVTQELADEKGLRNLNGVFVPSVSNGGSADKAGIKEGDVIIKIGDVVVNKGSDLQEQISKYHPGDKVDVTVIRNKSEKVFTAVLLSKDGSNEISSEINRDEKKVLGAEIENTSREERLSLIREIVEKSDNPKDLIVDEVDVEYIQADFFSDLGSDINRRISSHLMEMDSPASRERKISQCCGARI